MREAVDLLLIGGAAVTVTLLGYWLCIEIAAWRRDRRSPRPRLRSRPRR